MLKNILLQSGIAVLVAFGGLFTVSTMQNAPQNLGATVCFTFNGCTGTSSPSGILYGDNNSTNHLNTVGIGSGLSFSGGTLSSTAGAALATTTADYIVYSQGGLTKALKTVNNTVLSSSASADVVLAAVVSDSPTTGSRIFFKPGTYYLNATTTFNGTTDLNGSTWTLLGSGMGTTNFVTNNNADAFYFRGTVKGLLDGFTVYLKGGSSAVVASSTSGFRSLWNSTVQNITITGTTSLSTGWGFNLVNNDHNIFNNLYIQNVGNCMRTATDFENKFNPGDETWSNIHCTFNAPNNSGGSFTPATNTYTGGIGYFFDASATATIVNQYTLLNVLAFDGDGTRTAYKFNNASNVRGVSVQSEGFATTSEAYNGSKLLNLNFEYVIGSSGTTNAYFFFDSTSGNNKIGCSYVNSAVGTQLLFFDQNTTATAANRLEGVDGNACELHGSGTFTFATTSASIVRDVQGGSNGSALNQIKVAGDKLYINFATGGSEFVRNVGGVLQFENGGNPTGNTPAFAVSAAGNVGIRTNNPTATGLDVNGNLLSRNNIFVGDSSLSQGIWFDSLSTFLHGVHRSGNNNQLMGLRVGTSDIIQLGTTTNAFTGAATTTGQFNVVSSGFNGGMPVFTVATSSGTATTTTFNIDTNGNVSILAGSSLTLSTATTTASNGFSISAGCYAIGSTCAGLGSVTSVAASVPSVLSIAGSPITTSGTLAITYSGTALPLANGGTATTTWQSYTPTTANPLVFYNPTLGTLSETGASTGLFWDETNKRLGVGTTTPQISLDVWSSTQSTVYAPGSFSGLRLSITNANQTNSTFSELALSTASANGTFTTGSRIVGIFTSHTNSAVSSELAFVNRNAGTMAEDMRITKEGRVGIGTTTPFVLLDVASSSVASNGFGQLALTDTNAGVNLKHWLFSSESGNLYIGTTTDAYATSTLAALSLTNTGKLFLPYLSVSAGTPSSLCMNAATFEVTVNAALTCTVSSRVFKQDITALDIGGLSTLSKLQPVQFAYKDNPDRLRWGFIAEDVFAVNPKLADGFDKEGNPTSLDQNAILALTVKSVQELSDKVDNLSGKTEDARLVHNWDFNNLEFQVRVLEIMVLLLTIAVGYLLLRKR